MTLGEGLFRIVRSKATGYLTAVAGPILIVLFVDGMRLPTFVFEHLIVLLVVGCAVPWGMRPAVVAALVAVTADNLLLREPFGRPTIDGFRDVFDLVLFTTVAVVVGWVVSNARAERARAEQAAEQERRARDDRDRLIAMVSHDLAAPLTAIRGTIQFAQRFGDNAEIDMERLLERIDTAANRATSLVRALSDLQALDRGELALALTTVDLRELAAPIVQMFDRASERHPIVLAMPPGAVMIRGDRDRLQRVLENLISNAVKYSPHGGSIEVSISVEGRSAVLSVRDHGIGVSTNALPHIFERSYRAPEAASAAPGLGLGLTIAAEIVHLHGGTLEARQAEPQGSIFLLRLPMDPAQASRRHRTHAGAGALQTSSLPTES